MPGVFYFPLIGTPVAMGNRLSFFIAGTNTPLDVWSDELLSIPWNQPIILNSFGQSDGPIYVSPTPSYKVVYEQPSAGPEDFEAVPGYPVDFVSPSTITTLPATISRTALTNAQIKALPTTPVTLDIDAPESGVRIRVTDVSYSANCVSGAYTNINTTYADLSIVCAGNVLAYGPVNDGTTGATGTVPTLTGVTALLGGAAWKVHDPPIPWVGATRQTGTVDLAYVQSPQTQSTGTAATQISLEMNNNGSGNLTGGNAGNSMLVTVYYSLEPLA